MGDQGIPMHISTGLTNEAMQIVQLYHLYPCLCAWGLVDHPCICERNMCVVV
jgi:hypothetical protein